MDSPDIFLKGCSINLCVYCFQLTSNCEATFLTTNSSMRIQEDVDSLHSFKSTLTTNKVITLKKQVPCDSIVEI